MIAAAALVAVLLERHAAPWDLSRAGRNHLAAPTRDAARGLVAPVTATVMRPASRRSIRSTTRSSACWR
jgi:hypothetical protein